VARRIEVLLHRRVVVIKRLDRLDVAAALDQVDQSLHAFSCGHGASFY
jgi:hypothetical protein